MQIKHMRTPGVLTCLLTTALALGVSTGCATNRTGSQTKGVNSAKTLRMADWQEFAREVVSQVEASGVLDRYIGKKGGDLLVLGIAEFQNSVGRLSQQDFARTKDVMMNEIRSAFMGRYAGDIGISMAVAAEAKQTSQFMQSLGQLRESANFDQSTVPGFSQGLAPDLVLWGQVVTVEAEEGRTTEFGYSLQMRIADVSKMVSVWEGSLSLSKEYQKGLFGL